MKTLLRKVLLVSFIACFFIFSKAQAQVTFTALPGNASSYLAKGATNQVVFGFSVNVPGAFATFNPGPVHLAITNNLNGFVTGSLIRTSTNDPTLAISTPLNTYAVAENGTLDINTFPTLGGGLLGTTYYFYLVLSITNTTTAQPASVVFSLPSAANISQNGFFFGINVNNSTAASPTYYFAATPPAVTTNAATSIGTTTVTIGGNVTVLGIPASTDYGVVYSTVNTSPTITDTKVSRGTPSVTGNYTHNITSLSPGTTYYYRAYITNSSGTVYGLPLSFITLPVAPTSVTGGAKCGAGNVTLTAAGAPPGGSYKWYTVASAGTAIAGATGATYTPDVVTTTIYYASTVTAGGVESTLRTAGTATIYPIVSSPFPNAYLSYSFNTASPSVAANTNDVSGTQNDGIPQAAPTLTTDRFGFTNSAYLFNGSSQWMESTKLITNPQVFTISVWINTTTLSGGKIVGFTIQQNGGGNHDRHVYMDNSGFINFGVYSGATNVIKTTTAYNDGKWHHIVATLSSAGTKLFVDDILQAFNTSYTAAETNDGFWGIGGNNISGWPSNPSSSYFAGKIDDVAVYSTDLSSSVTSLNDLNQIGIYAPVCPGSPLTIYAPTITGNTFTWTDPIGQTATGQNGVFSSAVVGAYTLAVTGGTGACTPTATYTPPFNSLPTSAFTTSASSVNLNTNATITIAPASVVAGNTYSWSFGGGTPTPASTTISGPYTVQWATYGAKTISLTVTNSTGCSATSTQTINVGPSAGNYAFSQPITLNTASAGISSTLTNFPALVYIKEDALKTGVNCANNIQFATGGTNGYDFAFSLVGSTAELPYQVENYDPTTGTLLAWVQIPTVTSGSNTNLTFYFGSAAPLHPATFTATTWSSDYLSVYHFNELPTAGSATVLESTSGTLTGTPTAITQSVDQIHSLTGNIGGNGGGYTLGGSTSKIITSKKADISNSFTLSAWVNVLSTATNDSKIVTNELDFGAGYKLSIKGGKIETETRNTNFAGTTGNLGIGGAVSFSAWHYVQGIFDATTGNFQNYLDGAAQTTATTTSASSTNNKPLAGSFVSLGIDHGDGVGGINDGSFFKGNMDEVRISNVIKSADWIKAEYYNQTNPLTFTTSNTAIATNATVAAAIGGSIMYTWTGVSTDPTAAANWTSAASGNPNFAPPYDGFCSLLIKTGKPNYPKLTASKNIYGLTLEAGSTLNLNGFNLNVGCSIYNSLGGQILYGSQPYATDPTTANASTITWNGTGIMTNQLYTGSTTAATAQVGKMIINNTVTSGAVTINSGTLDIYNYISITAGNLAITSPAVLTLKSTAIQTASIDIIPSTYSITGNIDAERYMSGGAGRRGYRLLSAPINQGFVSGKLSLRPAYGFTDLQKTTPITGYSVSGTAYNSTTVPTNAFDQSLLGNPSVLFYNEADIDPINQQFVNSDYKGLATIGEKLPIGNGFLFFFRGDRNINGANGQNKTSTTSIPENTTLKWTGVPNQGPITVYIPNSPITTDAGGHKVYTTPATASTAFTFTNHSSNSDGLHLVGNPYASAIDLDQITVTNPSSNKFIYMLNNSNTFGTYTKGTPGSGNNGVGQYVASGQGFFVVGNNLGTTQVSFTEAAKVNASVITTTPTTFKVTGPKVLAVANNGATDVAANASVVNDATPAVAAVSQSAIVNITLTLDSNNTNETVIRFGDNNTPGNNKYNQAEDAIYRSGISQTTFLASYTADSRPCIVNTMGAIDTVNRVPLYVEGATDGLYTLKFKGASAIDGRYILYLIDHFMKDSLDLSANDTYAFNLQRGNAQTFGASRFEIVKHKSGVQYHLLGFNGAKKTSTIVLNWKTEHEGNYTTFALQRSTDGGKTFATIDSLKSDGSGNYSMTDIKPASGTNQYRLVQLVGLDTGKLSPIVTVGYQPNGNENLIANFDLYPNPSVDIIKLNLNKVTKGMLSIKIYNMDGRVVSNTKASADGTISQDVSKLLHGGYVIEVASADNSYYATRKFAKL